MPATYESGKVDSFTISVITDVEFALREMLELLILNTRLIQFLGGFYR